MILRSEAIPLSIHPWSRTSHMVTWLTETGGVITTPVKGACRPKSAYLGQYDLFYTCDLHYYRRDNQGVHAIRECIPLTFREGIRRRWRAVAVAGYLSDLVCRIPPGPHEYKALYALLSRVLDLLAEKESLNYPFLVLWYEIRLLDLLGLLPDLTLCPQCHTEEQTWFKFSFEEGRFPCSHRGHARPGSATLSLHRDVRSLCLQMIRFTELPPPSFLYAGEGRDLREFKNPLLGLSRFLGMFIRFHLDLPPAVRRVMWEMVTNPLI